MIFSVVLGRAGAEPTRRAILPHPEISFLVHLFLGGWRLGPVLDRSTLFNVPLGRLLAECSRTVRTLHHVLLLLRYLVGKRPDLVLDLRVIIDIRILLQSVYLFANAHGLDELVPVSFPLGYVFLWALGGVLRFGHSRTLFRRDSFGRTPHVPQILLGFSFCGALDHVFVHVIERYWIQSLVLGSRVSVLIFHLLSSHINRTSAICARDLITVIGIISMSRLPGLVSAGLLLTLLGLSSCLVPPWGLLRLGELALLFGGSLAGCQSQIG